MITQVKSFQTSDGKVFTDRGDAVKHDFKLEFRGLIQSKIPGQKSASYSLVEVGEAILAANGEFVSLFKRLNMSLGQINKAKKN